MKRWNGAGGEDLKGDFISADVEITGDEIINPSRRPFVGFPFPLAQWYRSWSQNFSLPMSVR